MNVVDVIQLIHTLRNFSLRNISRIIMLLLYACKYQKLLLFYTFAETTSSFFIGLPQTGARFVILS